MPLVRLEVRNEYGLGQPELYSEANREDPKAVLDGVAVAGLVGILRQLGDLAEFAAEVFHGLQEQVMTTASRSRNLMVRVQNIEAALPPLEKAVLSQTSHIHFAYTAGSEWHPRIQNAENHFIYNDLPRFIMDSYEECRDPPRLHLLDKFDTGGPGSCLKRYSDPTFFRRISGNFKEPDVEKVQKYKKTHKRKKKRSSHRNGDLLRSTSISNHSNRFDAAAPIVNGRSSPSHTASSIDMTLKSELGDHSNSFDSRTGSGHVECVFHLNSSAQPEQEYEEFSSYLRHNDIPESVFPEKQSAVTDDSFQQSLSPEQIAPSSSCVTWDEKAEIVEPRGQHSDEDEAPDIPTTDSDVDIQGRRISNVCSLDQMEVFIDENNSMFSASRNQLEEEGKRISDVRSLNQMEVVFNDENNPKLSASRNQLEEVESEADNYMDALNTIESESENDLDCQTKHEVEQVSSDVVNEENEDGIHGIAAQISEHYSPKHESHTLSEISSNDEILHVLPELDSLNSITEGEKTANISGKSSNLDCSPSLEDSTSSDALNDSKVGSVIDGPSSYTSRISNLQEPLNPDTVSSSFKPQESQPQVSGVHSVTIWTNGGLLGLQPSKPPDFTRSKTASQDVPSLYESETTGPQRKNLMSKNDGERVKEGVIDDGGMEGISNSKCSTSWHDDQDARVDKTDHANDNVRSSHAHGGTLNHISAVTQVNELPVDENVRATSTESKWENDDNSTQLFGLGRRLLANGFHRKTSLVPDNKPEPVSSLRAGVLEQRSGHRGLANHTTPKKESAVLFGHRSIIDPLTSSPPLEHMKISFHPMDDFGLSKLKLQFPDGSHCNESVRDAFPSFQLVPEPAVPLRDVGSDSDDDTFCRSSPYISDDYCSHHTESDSEEWEGGESPERKNDELYDSLCRTSSVEHVPTSLQLAEAGNDIVLADRGLKRLQGENGLDASLSATLLDFPSFDDMNPAIQVETDDNLDPNDLQEFQHPKESSPVPPPLPPVQWRVLKADSDIAESKQSHMFEAYEQTFDLKLLGTTLSQQPKPATAKEQQTNEGVVAVKPSNKQDPQKLIKQKEANQPANGKGMDEKEDFLHQIRSKSFTLRRTMTAKPTFGTGAAANDKVTAILEKANAIRQAVGSDDGDDDDNWSDT